ncbi:hypothetical protein [Sulfuriflexus sp.]|uniref:hypothetical protein n=1 Tax=Sulfuriflexus sp. TaxID=2015443 RepID=UPI0028CCEB16|nr:hypothetical protein [Sulfuriflexus sp.]MDT8405253.1 hypothetical protein [Sulfuriflexus sp.]
MINFFSRSPVLDSAASQWLFDAFSWALRNFDAQLFYNHTTLVLPTNDCFPGMADSPDTMANLILEQVKNYVGVSHWPTRLVAEGALVPAEAVQYEIWGALRDPYGVADESIGEEGRLPILYNPQQITNPEGLIAVFSHTLAHHLGQMADEAPPGGAEHWPHVTELLAIYTGFGVMFANSAFTFRGGCGSCYNPAANRDAWLSEREATYALAIFAVLKAIPVSAVTRYLKGHLRGVFKQAMKEINARPEDLQQLRHNASGTHSLSSQGSPA